MTSGSSVHEAGHPKPVLWDNPEGWVGEGEGVVQDGGDTCAPMADSCECMSKIFPLQYWKVINLQLNTKKK